MHYIKGANNIADSLSRLLLTSGKPCDKHNIGQEYLKFVTSEDTPRAMTTRETERASENNPDLLGVKNCLLNREWHHLENKHYLTIQTELSTIGK